MKLISLTSFLASLSTGAAIVPAGLEVAAYFGFVAAVGCIFAQDYAVRRPLCFESNGPTASQFVARFFFHRRAATAPATFRAPALAESNRLAA